MHAPKPEWLAALKALDDKADLRFNSTVGRWEFLLSSADGVVRSQFWCHFTATRQERYTDPYTGRTYEHTVPDRDPVTGLMPFRDLDDDGFTEALRNLERSFVGNPYDGAGTTRREVRRRYEYNERLKQARWKQQGEDYADYIWDHRRQIRDAGAGPLIAVAKELR